MAKMSSQALMIEWRGEKKGLLWQDVKLGCDTVRVKNNIHTATQPHVQWGDLGGGVNRVVVGPSISMYT